jgi:hypothetical protein
MRADNIAMSGSITPAVVTLVDATSVQTDCSKGNHFRVTIAGNRTLQNPSNLVDGQRLVWEIQQDGTGGRTITLDTLFSTPNNVPSVILTTTPNQWSLIAAIYNGSINKVVVTGFLQQYS